MRRTVATPSARSRRREPILGRGTYTHEMATSVEPVGPAPLETPNLVGLASSDESRELAASWRRLTRAATIVAVLTSPALIAFFIRQDNWPWWKAVLVTLLL